MHGLSPLGPNLELGAEMREAVSYSSRAGRFGLIATGVIGWLPGLVPADCGFEFSFYIWPGHCPFVYSVSHFVLFSLLRALLSALYPAGKLVFYF